jgi:hypothetical protein
MLLNKHSPKYRELLWQACANENGGSVICNLCEREVIAGDDWDQSHAGTPSALGGRTVGIAHRRCNREHGSSVVTPMVAKAKRQRRNHLGITGPGLGAASLPCGRNSGFKKTMRGEVVERISQSRAHREMMAKRDGGGE